MCGLRAIIVSHPNSERRNPGLEGAVPLSPQVAKFNELFEVNRLDILKYLLRRSANSDDAADALADTFLVAWRRIDAVPDGLEGRLWLFGVARNIRLKQFTKSQRATTLNDRLTLELRSVAPAPKGDEIGSDVRKAFSRLTQSDREIVELSAWEGLTPAEISSVLGISANAARVRLHRAKRRLAEILGWSEPGTCDLSHQEASEK